MSTARARLTGLGRDTIIFGLGVVLSRAASFIMLPLYTRFLTPADYGVLQILQTSVDALAIILAAGISAGLFRYYFKVEDERARNDVVSTTLLLSLGSRLIGSVALLAGAAWIAGLLLAGEDQAHFVWIVGISFVLEPFTTIPMLAMQVQQRAMLHTIASIGRLILQLSLNIYFVAVLKVGAVGILFSSLITTVVVGAVLGVWLLRQTGLRYVHGLAAQLWKFGIPLRFASIGTFAIQYGDRYVLKASHGLAEVGVYGLAYQFGFILLSLTSTPFLRAWAPRRFQFAKESPEVRDRLNNKGFLTLSLLLLTGAAGVCLFVQPALRIMSNAGYWGAAYVVPLVVLAQVFAVWSVVADLGISMSEQTRFSTYSVFTGVVVAVLLYALLIPRFGPLGAAAATTLSMLAELISRYYWSQRLWPMSYQWRPHLLLLLYASAVSIMGVVLQWQATTLAQLGIGVALFGIYLFLVWVGNVLTEDNKMEILASLRRPVQALRPRWPGERRASAG